MENPMPQRTPAAGESDARRGARRGGAPSLAQRFTVALVRFGLYEDPDLEPYAFVGRPVPDALARAVARILRSAVAPKDVPEIERWSKWGKHGGNSLGALFLWVWEVGKLRGGSANVAAVGVAALLRDQPGSAFSEFCASELRELEDRAPELADLIEKARDPRDVAGRKAFAEELLRAFRSAGPQCEARGQDTAETGDAKEPPAAASSPTGPGLGPEKPPAMPPAQPAPAERPLPTAERQLLEHLKAAPAGEFRTCADVCGRSKPSAIVQRLRVRRYPIESAQECARRGVRVVGKGYRLRPQREE